VKRFNLAVLWAAAAATLGAQTKAPKDLATLIQSGETKLALQQIQAGVDVNKVQPDGTSPLLWAINRGDDEVAAALIARKADVNAANEFTSTPLTEAARKSNARLVKMLLDAGAKVDSANQDGETALMMAISTGDLSVVKILVDAGANVNTIEEFHRQTPLMYAAASNKNAAPMVKLLLAKGADVKPRALYSDWPSQVTSEPRAQYRPVGGLTALLYAARSGCYECAEDLIAAGADVNLPTPEGMTPLIIALDNSHNDVAKLLMDKGANINVWDWWGRTPLWVAVDRKGGGAAAGGGFGGGGGRGGAGGAGRGGRGGPGGGAPAGNVSRGPAVSSMEIINALLNAGADPNPEMNFHRPNDSAHNRGRFADNQISTGTTPLFRAVQNNDLEAVQALLAKGADPNVTSMGYTAFLLAAGAGPGGRGGAPGAQPNMQIVDLLVQHSADVNAKVAGPCCGPDKLYSFDVSRENMGPCRVPASKGGTTALHEAARAVRTDMVKYLLEHGANPSLVDVDGKKPIDVLNVQRPRGNDILPCTPPVGGQAPPQGQSVAPAPGGRGGAGGGRGGPGGGGGANPAAVAEIRAMLEAAAAKK
jgi:ankyrin repeat protein